MKLINLEPRPRLPISTPPSKPEVSIRLPNSPEPTQLGRGSAGPEVESLQKNLKALGYPVEVDGKFGPETEKALKQYQKDHGLEADGIAGPLTHAQVQKDVAALVFKETKPTPMPTPRVDPRFDVFETGSSGGGSGGGGGRGW